MKLIIENFRKFSKEENFIYEKAVQNKMHIIEQAVKEDLNEMEITVGQFQLKAEWEKWAAMTGMTGAVCSTAAYIAMMYAPFEVVALAALGSLFANPLVLAITALIGLRFKFVRKILGKMFKFFLKPVQRNQIVKLAESIIQKMISASKGEITEEQAKEILAKFSEQMLNHPKLAALVKKMGELLDNGELKEAWTISQQADDLIRQIAMEEIFEPNPEQEDLLDPDPEFEIQKSPESDEESVEINKMKPIMENFRKNMTEMFRGREITDDELEKMDPVMRGFIEKTRKSRSINTIAKEKAIKSIMAQYTEQEMHEMVYDELEDLFMNRFADAHPENRDPDEDEIAEMMKACGIFKPEEEYDLEEPSDMDDPPGYMPGEGGNY